jgi:hypothetical protein
MKSKTQKQLDAIVTTTLFFNLILFGISFMDLAITYLTFGMNIFMLVVYKLISANEIWMEALLETNNFAGKLNKQL